VFEAFKVVKIQIGALLGCDAV